MKRQTERHRLPYSAEQMFDLAVDIERYPEFLPQWSAAKVRKRDGGTLTVDQELDIGIQTLRFTSYATVRRPERLQIRSSQSPFKSMLIDWRFSSAADGGSLVTLTVEFDLRSVLLEAAVGKVMQIRSSDIFSRFRRRAHEVYGAESPATKNTV
jgi:coenzyme Q-binding protein COQ10